MLDKKQEQRVDQGGTAIQAGGNVTITGMTYSDMKDVALDVFRANFYELAGMAKETAKARAEEITEEFLAKLENEFPKGFERAHDPDFQYALFTVQKEYARNGNRELGDLLVDLLVDRSKQEQRDIMQIVLNESLNTAPKLTDNHLAALAVVFLFRYTQNYGLGNHQRLGEYLDRHVSPFIPQLVKSMASYQHLEFTGCGSIGVTTLNLESVMRDTYQGLFLHGFDEQEVLARGISIGLDTRLFSQCLNNPSKIQVRAVNKERLSKILEDDAVPQEDRTKISELFDLGRMSDEEVRQKCIEIRPYMTTLFDAWSDSAMKHFTLTSVGIAIGHANIKRLVGEFADLSIWIN